MAKEKLFWFVDTRKNAKSDKPFAIKNEGVAEQWKRSFNNDEGPFKPVEQPKDFKEGGDDKPQQKPQNTGDNGSKSYSKMNKGQLHDELEKRDIEFNSDATNDQLVELLVKDDEEKAGE